MIYLLDVNLLIALFDSLHANHDAAHDWFGATGKNGWATCPITENGFVRIVSNPSYPTVETTPAVAAEHLSKFIQNSSTHHFWSDKISILDNTVFNLEQIHGSNIITDAYLLGLAAVNKGKLATFDQRIKTDFLTHSEKDVIEILR